MDTSSQLFAYALRHDHHQPRTTPVDDVRRLALADRRAARRHRLVERLRSAAARIEA